MPPSHALVLLEDLEDDARMAAVLAAASSRAWLKYASVYQPARIFSTGRSKISGGSRVLVV